MPTPPASPRTLGPKTEDSKKKAEDSKKKAEDSKKKGDIAYDQIMAAFDGCERNVRDFQPADFDNGYTRTQNKSLPAIPGAVTPTKETSFFIEYKWDKDFINNQGQPAGNEYTKAVFTQYYIPSSSAIVVGNRQSPASLVKRRFDFANKSISSQEIADRHVPPLHRWSDVTWTVWKEKGGDGNLRYIAYDMAGGNPVTEAVIEEILGKTEPEWPGRNFGMDSDEGRTLLGTLNGMGAARLLIDRASTMGKRYIRFYLFYSKPRYPCILIDLEPV
ncbi:MAG: hypothetical protein Q9223_002324 [Gallowayella weberi]